MANNFASNFREKLLPEFITEFQASRTFTKEVDTQIVKGDFGPSSGETVRIKRPHDYRTVETSDGDLTSETDNDIISGSAVATVQDYITIRMSYANVDKALKLNQFDQIVKPAARRMVTTLELNLGQFMQRNLGASYGTPGTAIDAWSDVAGTGAFAESLGVPSDSLCYVMNPFTQTSLASAQGALASGKTSLVDQAWQKGLISPDFAGMKVMSSNAIKTYTSGSLTDRAGAVNGTPTATYVAHKDTMIQDIPVDGFGAGADTIKAGEIVEVTGKFFLSHATRETVLGADGNPIKFRGVVTEDVTLSSGAGTLKVAGPAINETNGQYNSVDAAIADNDVITVLGSATTTYQPALWFHKNAIALASVDLPPLEATIASFETEDGIMIRVTEDSNSLTNTHTLRFDMLPVFGCMNPFFGGQAFGV